MFSHLVVIVGSVRYVGSQTSEEVWALPRQRFLSCRAEGLGSSLQDVIVCSPESFASESPSSFFSINRESDR